MNIERINTLIEAIRNGLHDTTFKMDVWIHTKPECGTIACIGGHVQLLWPFSLSEKMVEGILPVAERLGISEDDADQLCYPNHMDVRTKEQAIEVLERLRDTGEVIWPEVIWPDLHKPEVDNA